MSEVKDRAYWAERPLAERKIAEAAFIEGWNEGLDTGAFARYSEGDTSLVDRFALDLPSAPERDDRNRLQIEFKKGLLSGLTEAYYRMQESVSIRIQSAADELSEHQVALRAAAQESK